MVGEVLATDIVVLLLIGLHSGELRLYLVISTSILIHGVDGLFLVVMSSWLVRVFNVTHSLVTAAFY